MAWKIILWGSTLTVISYVALQISNAEKGVMPVESLVFYNAISAPPDSFDPLDFDAANNVFLGRLLYATPLEFDSNGLLTSSVLDKFEYLAENKTLQFHLKSNLQYENGEPIRIEDVALAIQRMALSRPNFPVIEKISGLKGWLQQKYPLKGDLSGLHIDGDILTITFDEAVEHPLFRFALELFSIIPSSSIDLETAKLKGSRPPGSGYYKLVSGDLGQRKWEFERRNDSQNLGMPQRIEMDVQSWSDALSSAARRRPQFSVVAGFGDVYLDPSLSSEIEKMNFKTVATPDAWHMVMKLNSENGGFQKLEARRTFITKLRLKLKEHYPKNVKLEESVFSKLLQGYVDYSDGKGSPSPLDTLSKDIVKEAFPSGLTWVGQEMKLPAIDDSISETCFYFGIDCKKLVRSEAVGKHYDLFVGLTGFWSYDPYGDIKMLFTPNLHKQLQDIAKDQKVQSMLTDLNSPKVEEKSDLAKKLDKYLHDQYIYNVVAHFPFVFAYSDSSATGEGIPQSGTLPYPWMFAR